MAAKNRAKASAAGDRLRGGFVRQSAPERVTRPSFESLENRTLLSTVGLVAWFGLNETSGTVAADSSGLGNDGTYINNPGVTAGKIDGARTFSSSAGSRVSVADDASLDLTTNITLSAWIRPTARATAYVIKKADSDAVDGYELGLSSSGRVFFRLNGESTGDSNRIDSTSSYPTNGSTWMHVAATYDGSTMRLYINGVQQASKSTNISIVQNNLALGVGAEAGGYRPVNGAIDDARVYNRALSAAEIVQVMNYTGEPVNAAPQVNAGDDQIIQSPAAGALLTGSATDDGLPSGNLTYAWSVVGKPQGSTVTITTPHAATTTISTDAVGEYTLRLTVSDGQLSSFDDVKVTRYGENQAPVADAGGDLAATTGVPLNLTATATDDGLPLNGPALTSTWVVFNQPSGSAVQFGNSSALNTTATFSAPGEYTLRLYVTDGSLYGWDELKVTVSNPANQAPVVNAGADQTVMLADGASLTGSFTDDGLPGDPASQSWSLVESSTGGTVTFGTPDSLSTTVTFSQAGVYRLRLSVNDHDLTGADDVIVTVQEPAANQPPIAFAGDDQTIALGQTVTLNAAKTDDGLPNGTLGHDWAVIEKPLDGVVTWQNFSSLTPTLSFNKAGTYTIRMFVGDGQYNVTDDVTITVNPAPTIDPALVGWWTFDENGGTTASDSSGKGNHGTLTGNPTWVAGKDGSGLQFTASGNRRVVVPDDATLDITNNITLAAWIKPNGSGTQYLIKKARSNSSDGYELAISSGGRAFFRLNDDSSGDLYRVDSTSLMPTDGNTWVHLMATYDGQTMRLYVNGQLQASEAASVNIAANSNPLGIGGQDNGYRSFNGVMDDVRVYNRALSAAEVTAIFEGAPPANQPPVVNAGNDQTIAYPDNDVELSGVVTDDGLPNGSVQYSWSVVTRPSGGVVIFSDGDSLNTTADFNGNGTWVLRLTAYDGQYTVFDDVTVNVLAEAQNQAPSTEAGPNQTVTLPNNTIDLTGQADDDGLPGGSSLSTQWSVSQKPSGSSVTFGNANALNTTATFSASGTYVLRLTASDGTLSAFDEITITVNPASGGPVDVDVTREQLNNTSLDQISAHKPQRKLWEAFGKWWSVLAASDGTWVYRLDNATWTKVLKLTNDTNTYADVLAVGNGGVVHALLQVGTTMKLASIQYSSSGGGTYGLWSTRSSIVTIGSQSGLEAATIEMDSTGRMWVAYDGSTSIYVRSATGNFSSWSSATTIASGISSDDISSIVKLNGQIGVMWSSQNAERFGFKTHVDGASTSSWSGDEIPGDSAALDIGGGMADDHLNVATASDGTVYVAIKTSYDSSGQTTMGLLVRRPNGQWDQQLYRVDTAGTRPIVVVNELEGALYYFYTTTGFAGTISYKKSPLDNINFGSRQLALSGSLDNVTSTRQVTDGQIVILATSSSAVASTARFTLTPQASFQFVGSLFNDDEEIT